MNSLKKMFQQLWVFKSVWKIMWNLYGRKNEIVLKEKSWISMINAARETWHLLMRILNIVSYLSCLAATRT